MSTYIYIVLMNFLRKEQAIAKLLALIIQILKSKLISMKWSPEFSDNPNGTSLEIPKVYLRLS